MLDDILEESWTYQEIVKKGLQKGMQQGLQQGMQQGLQKGREEERRRAEEQQKRWIREQREMIVNLVRMRFPEFAALAQSYIETINDTEVLHRLINRLFEVQTAAEAQQAIFDARTEAAERVEE